MDRFFDENRKKAKQVTVDNILQYVDDDQTYYTAAKLGLYLTKWNTLEDLTRKAVKKLGYPCSRMEHSWHYVMEEQVLPEDFAALYRVLRLQRNAIVHSNRLPEEQRFARLMEDMERLSQMLKETFDIK